LAGSSAFLFRLSLALLGTGACCHGAGESMGSTNWYTVDSSGNKSFSHNQDDGALCKGIGCALMMASLVCFAGSVGCYFASYAMLGLSFVYLYEEPNYFSPSEYFVINTSLPNFPETIKTYSAMTEGSRETGKIDGSTVVFGQLVYTGWIYTSNNDWIHCSKYGKMLFHRAFKEEYEAYSISCAEKGEVVDPINIIMTISTNKTIAPTNKPYPSPSMAQVLPNNVNIENLANNNNNNNKENINLNTNTNTIENNNNNNINGANNFNNTNNNFNNTNNNFTNNNYSSLKNTDNYTNYNNYNKPYEPLATATTTNEGNVVNFHDDAPVILSTTVNTNY